MTARVASSPQRQAVMWEVRLRAGDAGDAELRAFERWRGATAANAVAWDALQDRLAQMGGGRSRASMAMAHALRVPSTERRRVLRAAFGVLALGVGAWGAASTRQISGVFRLDDIDSALLQVAAALPVKLTRYGRYLAVFN